MREELVSLLTRQSDSPVSMDAGIEPNTVATLALAIKHSNHSARSHIYKVRTHRIFILLWFFQC